jgi:hypothetical protein
LPPLLVVLQHFCALLPPSSISPPPGSLAQILRLLQEVQIAEQQAQALGGIFRLTHAPAL